MAASYVTGQDNPWFAKAYINRIWYVLMGEAFYEPIDDIGPGAHAAGGRSARTLWPTQWQKGGYDIRWLFRTILNTDAYQRRVRSTFNAAGKTPFASSCPSRLRADQVFDALVHALALPLDANGNLIVAAANNGAGARPARRAGPKAQARLARAALKKGENPACPIPTDWPPSPHQGGREEGGRGHGARSQVGKKAAVAMRAGGPRLLFDRLFGVDPSVPNEDVMGTIPQALFLMNGPLVSTAASRPGPARCWARS